jgi:hypothetical protein
MEEPVAVYEIVVRNELTGELVTLAISGSVAAEAQTTALLQLFRTRGWRKASAFPPGSMASGLGTDVRAHFQ